MLKYFQTTTLILLWCFGLGLAWAALAYWRVSRPGRVVRVAAPELRSDLLVPALVLGPLALVLAFRVFSVNLLFPVHLFAEGATLVVAALAPALVLVVASGLGGELRRAVRQEFAHWRAQPFATVALAVGRSPRTTLARLVLAKSLARAWSQCLPWLFGELIIVETVFNAPGLGLDAWHAAKIRDFGALAATVGWLAAIYALCVALTAATHRWLGRKLESYA
jgi:ABC-type dipeptide/oligopeptide/nickel transport system permease component